jgi:hypothetical protein
MFDIKKDLVYLASPYSKYPAGREIAFREVSRKAAELMNLGYNIFCPIAHSHPVDVYGTIEDNSHAFWLKQDFAVLQHCKLLLVYTMPGWKDSYGVNAEMEFANKINIPIMYISYDETRAIAEAA